MGSAVNQSPGGCECEEGTCTGTVCVDLAAPCNAAHDDGYTITVRKAGTSTVLGTATTDSNGVACVTLPEAPEADWPMLVDVTATKANCQTVQWLGRSVACDSTYNAPPADVRCGQNSITYTVRGCFSVVLPGATVTLTRPSTGYSYSAVTNSAGVATIYGQGAGNGYFISITHPAGFSPFNLGPTTMSACGASSNAATLNPDADHACCEIQKHFGTGNWSPYPIKKTLTVTDQGGSSSLALDGCGGSVCQVRTMDHVGSQDAPLRYPCSDIPTNEGTYAPPVGTGTSPVRYRINLNTAVPTLAQELQNYTPIAYMVKEAYRPLCNVPNVGRYYQSWRKPVTCSTTGDWEAFAATSLTVHSLHPLLITFNYAQLASWGPNDVDPVTGVGSAGGGPYATSVVVSE